MRREGILDDPKAATALQYLARLAALNAGYSVRGRTGWAHVRDVEAGTRLRLPEVLVRLHGIGLLDRTDVRPATANKEEWVYRVNDVGARESATIWGEQVQRVDVRAAFGNDSGVYLPANVNRTLDLLRLAADEPGRIRFGEPGWRTGAELTDFIEQLNRRGSGQQPYSRIDTTELLYLVRVGFAEKREFQFTWGRSRPAVYWRVSAAGKAARLLSWREPRLDQVLAGNR